MIRDAFRTTPYPGDDDLASHAGNNPDSRRLLEDLRGLTWLDVSAAMVLKHKDDLPWFTPAGFRYYLPAYMIAVVDHTDDVDVAHGSTISMLTRPPRRRGWDGEWFEARARLFTEPERDAIRSFLDCMVQIDLEAYENWPKVPLNDRAAKALAFWQSPAATRPGSP